MSSSFSATVDNGVEGSGYRGRYRRVTCAWTSDASGNAGDTVANNATSPGTLPKMCGRLIKAVTVPAGGGSAPTDNYDIAITDEASVDVLAQSQNTIQNRDTANTEEVYFLINTNNTLTPIGLPVAPIIVNVLTVTVSNAGNAKSGTIILYVEE